MSARDEILAALRAAAPPGPAHPALDGLEAHYADLAAALADSVAAVGGALIRVSDLSAADAALRALKVHQEAKVIVSLVPGVGAPTLDASTVKDPHDLAGLDLVVLPAALAVAENGACWIEGHALPHHALAVIPEHVVVVVDQASIVPDMHAAYSALDLKGRPRFGLFLAGPSKTADIEQALVIGAHGARSSTTLLVGAP
jgi:L-lactate dehydrogenase complex protein LldG